jgi:hypothetical protein
MDNLDFAASQSTPSTDFGVVPQPTQAQPANAQAVTQPVLTDSPVVQPSTEAKIHPLLSEVKEVFPVFKYVHCSLVHVHLCFILTSREWQQKHQDDLGAKKLKSEQEREKMKQQAEEFLANENSTRSQINQKRKEANMYDLYVFILFSVGLFGFCFRIWL